MMDAQAQIDKLRQARWSLALEIVRMQAESEAVRCATGKGIPILDYYVHQLRNVMFTLSELLPDEFMSGDADEILKDGCPKS